MPTGIRERIAIVFMTVSLIATLSLGGSVIYELSRPRTVAAVTPATQQAPGAAAPGASLGAPTGAAAPGNGAGSSNSSSISFKSSSNTAGVTSTVITVGGIYDETGPVDATVERDTVRAYFDKINAAGGVNGHQLRLIDCDSGFDPTRAHECSQRLISQGVLAIVGWLSASGEQAEAKYLSDQGVPIIGGLGVPSEFQQPLSWPVVANLTTVGVASGAHAKDLNVHHPGIVLLNLPFIQPVKKALLDSLHKHGITEKSVDEVDATKADYTDIAVKLRSENVDSVIAGLDPYSYARFFQAMDRQNYHPRFSGLGLDKSSANQQYGTAVYGAESLTSMIEPLDHQSDPAIADYLNTVKHYFPGQYDALDLYAQGDWIAAEVFVEAIRRIGSSAISRSTLVSALNGIRGFQTGMTVPISYHAGSSHDPNRCFQFIHNVKGQWTTYSGWRCY